MQAPGLNISIKHYWQLLPCQTRKNLHIFLRINIRRQFLCKDLAILTITWLKPLNPEELELRSLKRSLNKILLTEETTSVAYQNLIGQFVRILKMIKSQSTSADIKRGKVENLINTIYSAALSDKIYISFYAVLASNIVEGESREMCSLISASLFRRTLLDILQINFRKIESRTDSLPITAQEYNLMHFFCKIYKIELITFKTIFSIVKMFLTTATINSPCSMPSTRSIELYAMLLPAILQVEHQNQNIAEHVTSFIKVAKDLSEDSSLPFRVRVKLMNAIGSHPH